MTQRSKSYYVIKLTREDGTEGYYNNSSMARVTDNILEACLFDNYPDGCYLFQPRYTRMKPRIVEVVRTISILERAR